MKYQKIALIVLIQQHIIAEQQVDKDSVRPCFFYIQDDGSIIEKELGMDRHPRVDGKIPTNKTIQYDSPDDFSLSAKIAGRPSQMMSWKLDVGSKYQKDEIADAQESLDIPSNPETLYFKEVKVAPSYEQTFFSYIKAGFKRMRDFVIRR